MVPLWPLSAGNRGLSEKRKHLIKFIYHHHLLQLDDCLWDKSKENFACISSQVLAMIDYLIISLFYLCPSDEYSGLDYNTPFTFRFVFFLLSVLLSLSLTEHNWNGETLQVRDGVIVLPIPWVTCEVL